MIYIKTYESFFSRIFKKVKDKFPIQIGSEDPKEPEHPLDDERFMSDERMDQISNTISDCLQDIFDKYDIPNFEDDRGVYWEFETMDNYASDRDPGTKKGVNIREVPVSIWDEITDDIIKLRPKMEELCGVRIHVMDVLFPGPDHPIESDDTGDIEIDFPYWFQKSYSVRDERKKMGYVN